jgi:hypothetical protein
MNVRCLLCRWRRGGAQNLVQLACSELALQGKAACFGIAIRVIRAASEIEDSDLALFRTTSL